MKRRALSTALKNQMLVASGFDRRVRSIECEREIRTHTDNEKICRYCLEKIRFASSSVSFDPMSYQMPGTFQV
jgi:hypothetical protein